jgi:hypothetical protein
MKGDFVNITIKVPEHAYLNARIWAVQNRMSLSAAMRVIFEELPNMPGPQMRARLTENERTLALRKAAKIAEVPL